MESGEDLRGRTECSFWVNPGTQNGGARWSPVSAAGSREKGLRF